MNEYIVKDAYVKSRDTDYDFVYDTPRDFQADFIEWLNEGDEPTVALNAPTGAGKTATFKQLIEQSDGIVLMVYPTNALIEDQKKTMKEDLDATVKHLTGGSLNKHGLDRASELKSYFEKLSTDVIITNPDVLQAIVQGAYVDPSGRLVEVFEYCSAVVYDEFHFYDEFAASGILLQTKIAVRRMEALGEARIIFSSATPDETYFTALEKMNISHKFIQSNIQDGNSSQFRFETKLKVNHEYIDSITPTVAMKIKDNVDELESLREDEYKIAVICNSVKASNQLYNQFTDKYPDLKDYVVKDNGYDTNNNNDSNGCILITTSKAEIGLDHDIEYLHMDEPYNNPDSFIQRFGRAGRSSKAKVEVYGLGIVNWSTEMEYSTFVDNIYDTMDEQHANMNKLRNYIGLRAAYALYERNNIKQQLVKDLKNTELFDKWYNFLKSFEDVKNGYIPRDQKNLINVIEESLPTLKTLRGSSQSTKIKYMKGDEMVTTTYSLLSAITQYSVKKVEYDNTIVLDGSYLPDAHSISVVGLAGNHPLENLADLYDVKSKIVSNSESSDLIDDLTVEYLKIMDYRNIVTVESINLTTHKGVSRIDLKNDKFI